ncbi:MAG: hypothetical protein ACPGR8_15440, partial [Limisphaerales bacterium]
FTVCAVLISLTAPACAGANDEPGPGTWVVPGSSTVVSGPENYTLPGKLVLVGPDISILSVTVEKTIELRGDDLSNTVVSDVTIVGGDELVGLRAMRASPTAPLSNLSGCEFTNIVATNSNTSVAITQAYDLPMAVTCLPSSPQVVLQPAVPFTQLDIDASCTEILDLADLLNEFGRLYEISFFNPEARATNGALSSIVRILLVTDAILLIAIFLCFGKPVEAIRKDKDD